MIGFLKGEICAIAEDALVIDVMGVGYNVMITGKDASRMPRVGEEVKVYTYLSVREDAMKLYGFLAQEDLEFFKLLIGVNSVGPKVAQGILSVMDTEALRYAILSDDSKTISACPNIGPKTAKKIILELKDKVNIADYLNAVVAAGDAPVSSEGLGDSRKEAVEALLALGFSSTEALRAVKKVENADELDVEEIIKAALKYVG